MSLESNGDDLELDDVDFGHLVARFNQMALSIVLDHRLRSLDDYLLGAHVLPDGSATKEAVKRLMEYGIVRDVVLEGYISESHEYGVMEYA